MQSRRMVKQGSKKASNSIVPSSAFGNAVVENDLGDTEQPPTHFMDATAENSNATMDEIVGASVKASFNRLVGLKLPTLYTLRHRST